MLSRDSVTVTVDAVVYYRSDVADVDVDDVIDFVYVVDVVDVVDVVIVDVVDYSICTKHLMSSLLVCTCH